jgi:hypothetical protein
MKTARRLYLALLLAAALLVGQQAAMLHELGHATQKIASEKGSTPASHSDEECFLSAQLCGGAAVTLPVCLAAVITAFDPPAPPARSASLRPRAAFQPRAPPVLPV